MTRPAYQHYPGDEERDPSVRMLSLAAFGLWRRVLNTMHFGAPYGHLTAASGEAITPEQLARLVGESTSVVRRLLAELEKAGVFSRNDGGVIYSRRMVRDEHNRNVRAAGGARSLENPNVPRPKEDGSKDRTKDRDKDAHKDTFATSLQGSPAVAVAVASAPATTTTTVERIDPTSLPRWPELAEALGSEHARGHVIDFLTRCSVDSRAGWVGRLANWLQGLDCPPSYRPTPEVLSAALSEYEGTCDKRHVWAFVEDVVRRFERAAGATRQGAAAIRPRRGTDEGAQMFATICGLARSSPNPQQGISRYIPLVEVEKLGPAAISAYDRIGGATRVLGALQKPDNLGFLAREFSEEYATQSAQLARASA